MSAVFGVQITKEEELNDTELPTTQYNIEIDSINVTFGNNFLSDLISELMGIENTDTSLVTDTETQ